MSSESLELRVMPVTFRAPAQYRLRKQRLAPERDQALRIKISRMNGPEAQAGDL